MNGDLAERIGGEGANMTEATWGDAVDGTGIDWRMSAALENVPRGDDELAEVTSLEGAVREWLSLDPEHRGSVVLTSERPLLVDGSSSASFTADGIAALAERIPVANDGA